MATTALTLKRNWYVLSSLVSRDFKLKYRRSVLGVLWSVLNPLLMMIVMTVVFSKIFRFNIENYALYLILGQTLFAIMGNSTGGGLWAITGNAGLIKKIRIDKAVFPIQKVISELVNFAFSLVGVVIVLIYFKVVPGLSLLLLPVLLIYMIMFSIGLCLALSALAVFFRDMVHLWGVFMLMWTYATPIFYPAQALTGSVARLMKFNPMYQYVTYFRNIAMYQVTPGLRTNLICLGAAVVMLGIGAAIFKATEKRFILYV
jgi:ABC-2 type transport system permease protein